MTKHSSSKTARDNSLIMRAFIKSLPVMAGYLVLGIGFGMLAYSRGLGIWLPLVMSIFIYAGSLQYVAIDLLAGGAGFLASALTAAAVNARHLLYGLSMLDKYKNAGKRKPYLIFALTDETYSLLVGKDPDSRNCRPAFYFWVSLFNQLYWVSGSLLGVLAGHFLPINTKGIEFSLTALFITVAVDQWTSAGKHWPAIVGGISSILCRLIFGPDSFLIPAMITIVILLSAPEVIQRLRSRRAGAEAPEQEMQSRKAGPETPEKKKGGPST